MLKELEEQQIKIFRYCQWLETHVYLAFYLDFINEDTLNNLIINIEEIEKMIFGFKKSLDNQI
ncbi:MAG: hypothetical protein COW71_11045 [Ignavibacteriales bacterium CG18_big_fil_WC_8_21_14_2_50_31_20]|nr:MAG: hypothetical protein COW71_11045 [Ignavibacteriales bacterium CG18_big_fil_WC_8_21_14_2_50_31_20]